MENTTEVIVPATPKYMTLEQAIGVLTQNGLAYEAQSGFLKVAFAGGRIYIASTKTVRRVDISGFEVPLSLGMTPPNGPFGAVKQQLRLGDTATEALENLRKLVGLGLQTTKPEPVVKVKKEKAVEVTATAVAAELKADPRIRLAAIAKAKEIASKLGHPVSPKLIAEETLLFAEVAAEAPRANADAEDTEE